ncbi:MAG: hypothetical protein Q8R98_20455 [Rubrivivax sp.]|jgi:hypothetical protein|uniref:Uncharacterized protein n=1 Tax=Sphaerotilus uruguayifluvii TaxID=2735897 RepID=A0ABX2G4R2_9BURK|nr:hypothetical protein [Leptothrix sp. C29]MCP5233013.1 hypothetical protein [Zoogloeaceae bacterium]MCZ2439306.1 hypothetical protein [Burkholderiales bacterium]MDO9095352.1 hypothetical protein [Rubrivivax sp.]HMW23547.1 hypothetical protein [Burkholderiaceae bacterium]HNK17088.1 hypothetical protein [Piscinibacter sp.]
MHTDARLVPGRVRLLSVQAPEDIEYLVKESEVLTGRSGRTFVIAGADRLVYRVHWQPLTESGGHAAGPVVERLGHHGEVLSRQHLQLWEFLEHSLVEAQAAGQLFTPPVRTTP